jgi:hypothetical protein
MATQRVNPMPPPPRRVMVESKAPQMFKFVKQGDELAGHLIAIESVTVNGKSDTLQYLVRDDQRNLWSFLGTNDLNKKIHADDVGRFLAIRYESDDDSFTKQGQNPAKVFRVFTSEEKEVNG